MTDYAFYHQRDHYPGESQWGIAPLSEHQFGYTPLPWDPDRDKKDAAIIGLRVTHDMHLPNKRNGRGVFDETGQGRLFRSKPAESQAHTFYSTQGIGGKHVLSTLMGLAGMQGLRETGRMPLPDESLSASSSRIVHGLADKGIINRPVNEERNTEDQDREGADWDARVYAGSTAIDGRRLSPAEANLGQQFFNMVARPQPEKPSPHQQMELW